MNSQAQAICHVLRATLETASIHADHITLTDKLILLTGPVYLVLSTQPYFEGEARRLLASAAFINDLHVILNLMSSERYASIENIAYRLAVVSQHISAQRSAELVNLLAGREQMDHKHELAVATGINVVLIGIMATATAHCLDPETTQPQSVAEMLAYICHNELNNAIPGDEFIEKFSSNPRVKAIARSFSDALSSPEFHHAVAEMQEALAAVPITIKIIN